MRVLTTTLCYPTPADPEQGIFVRRRAEALAARDDVEASVVSPQPWCPLLRRNQAVETGQHPLPACYPKMFSMPVVGWAADGLAFARSIERMVGGRGAGYATGIDVIDAHFVYPDGVGSWLAGRRLGIPVVVTVRGKIVRMSRGAVRQRQIRAMLRGVDARIAVSESLARWVHDVGGSDLRVDVIPNGVDVGTHHLVARDRARSALGWDPQARYVLSVGHMQELKGFDRLVAIMPTVRAGRGDVRLVLVGSGRGERWFRRRLQRSMARCNADTRMDPCVQFVGPVPGNRLNLMYNGADVYVNASRSEGWCNAIAESLAAGTAVVATDVGGNREQICSSELGTVVPDGDMEALAGAVIAALSREWNRPLIAAHGSARRWVQVADEVYAVFARVLAARAAARSGEGRFFPLAGPGSMPASANGVASMSEVS